MNNSAFKRRSAGFSLIEVLIAVVVLSFGLLALAALQGSLFRASTETKAQSAGLGLASEKLEYFRGYKDLAAYRGITDGADAAVISVGGVDYTRSWTVTRYALRISDKTFVSVPTVGTLSTTTYVENNEFKRILVNVTWTSAENKTERVSLEAAVAALDPSDSAKLGKLTAGALPRGPEVRIYNPEMQQQGVIPIAIGNGTDTAATNPKPLVNNTNVIETRFDVLTYNDLLGNTAVAQSRVETSLVGCSCSYGNPVAGAMRPTYWDGARYSVPETSAAVAGSAYAAIAGPNPAASAQSSLCTICCRDHHDPGSLPSGAARFDPRDTTHSLGHQLLNPSTGVLSSTRAMAGVYTESCRVIRVGGLFRVAADTYNDYQNFLETWNTAPCLSTDPTCNQPYLPTTTATTNYQNFVKEYLRARVVNQSSQTNWNNVLPITSAGTVAALETANSVFATQPQITFGQNDPPKWLHLRGLYVDYLEDKALQAIKDARDNCQGTGTGGTVTAADLDSCVLKVLPFTSINLTELGVYSPLSGDQIVVANNNFYDTLGSTAPVRGKIVRGSNPTNNMVTDALATMRRSNSGLTTLINGVDTNDSTSTWTATQPVKISGAGSGGGGGRFYVNIAGYPFTDNPNTPSINDSLGATCNYLSSTPNNYVCTASQLSVPRTLTFGRYNYSKAVTSGDLTLSCTDASTNTTFSHTFASNGQGVQSINVCKRFDLTGLPALQDGLMAETTSSIYTPVANDIVTVTVTATTPDTQSYTCTLPVGGDRTRDKDYVVAPVVCP